MNQGLNLQVTLSSCRGAIPFTLDLTQISLRLLACAPTWVKLLIGIDYLRMDKRG